MEKELNAKEKAILLEIARKAIDAYIRTGELPSVEPREEKALNVRSGCFVSIKQAGNLRGCIGNFQSEHPLFREVAEIAVASATKDPRFYPMKKEDLNDFSLEISVLSPLSKIENFEEIEVGKHGIVRPASRPGFRATPGRPRMPKSTSSEPRYLGKKIKSKKPAPVKRGPAFCSSNDQWVGWPDLSSQLAHP
ncbi:MAG: AmmeMemoRadiSam system protein A [Desulfuromonadales bacterium]